MISKFFCFFLILLLFYTKILTSFIKERKFSRYYQVFPLNNKRILSLNNEGSKPNSNANE